MHCRPSAVCKFGNFILEAKVKCESKMSRKHLFKIVTKVLDRHARACSCVASSCKTRPTRVQLQQMMFAWTSTRSHRLQCLHIHRSKRAVFRKYVVPCGQDAEMGCERPPVGFTLSSWGSSVNISQHLIFHVETPSICRLRNSPYACGLARQCS